MQLLSRHENLSEGQGGAAMCIRRERKKEKTIKVAPQLRTQGIFPPR